MFSSFHRLYANLRHLLRAVENEEICCLHERRQTIYLTLSLRGETTGDFQREAVRCRFQNHSY